MKTPGTYLLSAAICAVLLGLPLVAVTFPPITDLPQQTAQVRLLFDALGDGEGPYLVQWTDPNKLSYLPLVLGWLVAGPLAAGRLGLLVIGLLWIGAIHALAQAADRRPAAAAAASMFLMCHVFYWGFLNFLIGFPVFVLWLLFLRRAPSSAGWKEAPLAAVLALSLYSAHVLWLAAGLVFLLGAGLRRRWPPRSFLLRLLWLLPALAAVAVWYPTFTAAGFDSATTWGHPLLQRLHPGWLVGSALGGLRGGVEMALAAVLLAWLGLGLWQSRGGSERSDHSRRLGRVDGELLVAGLLFLVAAFALPSVHQHTIFFASRWVPVAAVFLVLACPPPRLRPILELGFPLLLVAALSAATTATWIAFEDEELAGFPEALARLPPEPRVLGLDFVRTSERIRDFPYYHLYAYSQVLRGGELNRTFANEASSLVVYRDLPRPYPWTDGLDWRARKVRKSDVVHFDHVLVHGGPEYQAMFLADERLRPLTGAETGSRWRLYRVEVRASPPPGGRPPQQ